MASVKTPCDLSGLLKCKPAIWSGNDATVFPGEGIDEAELRKVESGAVLHWPITRK